MSLLEVKNLKKSFGDNVVLKDISFNVEKGEVFPLLGHLDLVSLHCSDALQIWKLKTAERSILMEPSVWCSRISICSLIIP